MVATEVEKEFSEEMRQVGLNLSPDMLSKCIGVAMNYKISASELATCWEAHSMNTNAEELTAKNWTSYRSALEKKYAKTPKQHIHKAAVVSRSAMAKRSTPSSSNGNTGNTGNVTPLKKQKVNSEMEQLEQIVSSNVTQSPQKKDTTSPSSAAVTPPSRASPAVQYENRQNAGNVVVAYNPHNLDPILSSSLERTCIITQHFDGNGNGKGYLTKGYKFMTDKNRHAPLDQQLMNMTEAIMEDYQIRPPSEEEDLEEDGTGTKTAKALPAYEHVGVPRQSLQTNIGRICNVAHDGKLNSTSLLLEGSKHGSHGARIELDVSHLDHYSLFQGQIVAVTGHNLSGKRMVVEKLMEGRMHENGNGNANVKQGDLEQSQVPVEGQGQGAKIYAVAGPYTTSQNLEYQPLTDLLGVVEVEKPDVVILMGPFVDMKQDVVKNGEDLVLEYEDGTKRHVCYEQFFAAKIAAELEALYEAEPDLKTQFVLVPSMDDAVSEPVFPQPPLESPLEKIMKIFPETEDMPYGSLCLDSIETAGGKKMPKEPTDRRIHLVSNPSTIKINDAIVGFTSLDAFMHMSTETVNTKLPTGRMNRLAEHFIKQRSYYPIFPPSAGHGKDFNIDVTKMDAYSMPVQPDVLILPSKLTGVAMNVANGTTVVNPGHLVRGAIGGTFAIMDIHPTKKENGTEGNAGHSVKDRIRVEVRRI